MQTPAATMEDKEPSLFLEDMTARISLTPAAAAAAAAAEATATAAATTFAAKTPEGRFCTCGRLDASRCITGMVRLLTRAPHYGGAPFPLLLSLRGPYGGP